MSNESYENDVEKRRLIFIGRVQGIGFRYTTRSISQRYEVTGYVKNLPDGTVEVVAVGFPSVIDAFVRDISSAFADKIDEVATSFLTDDEEFEDFRIRH